MGKTTRFRIGEKVKANITIGSKIQRGQSYVITSTKYNHRYDCEFVTIKGCNNEFCAVLFDPDLPSYGMVQAQKIKTLIELDQIMGEGQ